MVKAIWNEVVVAESDATIFFDNNHYFPREALNAKFFVPSTSKSACAWKGNASYLTIEVNGQRNEDAAWIYQDPKPEAKVIQGYVGFWKGVEVK